VADRDIGDHAIDLQEAARVHRLMVDRKLSGRAVLLP
jgi:hypothetical protein